MTKVLLFKSAENSGDYKMIFQNNGYHPIFLPVLEFEYQNLEKLYKKLNDHEKYYGAVFTSPRGIEAVRTCMKNENPDVLKIWENKKIFVVGEMSNRKLLNELNWKGCGESSGNANSLAKFIIDSRIRQHFDLPLLFPCGNLKSETLPQKLSEGNISLDCIVTYNTTIAPKLKQSLLQIQDNGGLPSILIFFSPSGVDFVLPLLKDIDYDFEHCIIVSIGPTTEKRLRDSGLNVILTAKEPTPFGVFNALCPQIATDF